MNSLQAIADSPMVYRLGWILLHSIWQALAVAIGLAVLLPALRRAAPVPDMPSRAVRCC